MNAESTEQVLPLSFCGQQESHTADEPHYLDVRYALTEKPISDYPQKLCTYLTEQYLQSKRGSTLLDLGCGRGEFLHAFSKLGFRAVGVDRERFTAHASDSLIHLCNIESQALPFSDDSFDIIFNKSVLEHVRDITPLLYECRRVLRPGGIFLSLVPDFKAQWSHFYDDWTHVRPFTLTGLSQCLQSHGFLLDDVRRFRQLPVLWRRPYLHPLADISTLLPSSFKHFKWIRFSKEWMLLACAHQPPAIAGSPT